MPKFKYPWQLDSEGFRNFRQAWKERFDGDIPMDLWKMTKIAFTVGVLLFLLYIGTFMYRLSQQLRPPETFMRETLSLSGNRLCPGERFHFRVQVRHNVRRFTSPVARSWFDVTRQTYVESGSNDPLDWRIVTRSPQDAWLEVTTVVPPTHRPSNYLFLYGVTAANADVLDIPIIVVPCEEKDNGQFQGPSHQDDCTQPAALYHCRDAAYPGSRSGQEQSRILSGPGPDRSSLGYCHADFLHSGPDPLHPAL